MRSFRRPSVLLFLAIVNQIGQQAHGQIINQYFPQGIPGYDTGLGVTVQSRVRDEYVAHGIRAGEVVVKPSLTESIGYNSNVSSSAKPRGSLQINTGLTLQGSTDWQRNGLFTYLSVDDVAFPDLPKLNQTSWVAAVGGTHDFGHDQLQLSYTHFNLQQTAADLGGLSLQKPATFHVDDVRASYKADFSRISMTPGIRISEYTFDQASIAGVQSSQQYRDRTSVSGNLTFGYAFAPQRNVLLVFSGYNTQYAFSQLGQASRDNVGLSVLGGLEYTANGVFRYRGLIGLEQRSYVSSLYATHATPVGQGEVIWTPTGLTTVTAGVSRAIEDAESEAGGGYVYTAARLTVDHEYKKNILLQADCGIQMAYFAQGGSQTIGNIGGGVTWLLNRRVRLAAAYDFTSSNVSSAGATAPGNTYRRNLILLRLSLGL